MSGIGTLDRHRDMSSIIKRSPNFSRAMQRSAERRRCPNCERKSAMVRIPGEGSYCRWCGYERQVSIDCSNCGAPVLDSERYETRDLGRVHWRCASFSDTRRDE